MLSVLVGVDIEAIPAKAEWGVDGRGVRVVDDIVVDVVVASSHPSYFLTASERDQSGST